MKILCQHWRKGCILRGLSNSPKKLTNNPKWYKITKKNYSTLYSPLIQHRNSISHSGVRLIPNCNQSVASAASMKKLWRNARWGSFCIPWVCILGSCIYWWRQHGTLSCLIIVIHISFSLVISTLGCATHQYFNDFFILYVLWLLFNKDIFYIYTWPSSHWRLFLYKVTVFALLLFCSTL